MAAQPEGKFKQRICGRLKRAVNEGFTNFVICPNDAITRGISDLVLCWNGRYVAIELKMEGNKCSDLQQIFLTNVVRQGHGKAFVMTQMRNGEVSIQVVTRAGRLANYRTIEGIENLPAVLDEYITR
jgi:hypothetical protein